MRNVSLCIACTGVGAGLGVGTINAVAEAAKSGSGYLAAAVVGLPALAAVAGAVGFGLVGSLHGVGMRDMGDAERPREAVGEGARAGALAAVLAMGAGIMGAGFLNLSNTGAAAAAGAAVGLLTAASFTQHEVAA